MVQTAMVMNSSRPGTISRRSLWSEYVVEVFASRRADFSIGRTQSILLRVHDTGKAQLTQTIAQIIDLRQLQVAGGTFAQHIGREIGGLNLTSWPSLVVIIFIVALAAPSSQAAD